jgi:hypothetical protein
MPALVEKKDSFARGSPSLETFGFKFTEGGAHISRTIMLAELGTLLDAVPRGSPAAAYQSAILDDNVLSKSTVSTRQKTLRHLRELYGLDESIPAFAVLRMLDDIDPSSRALLAIQTAWSRDPLLRATTSVIESAHEGEPVDAAMLADAIDQTYSDRYSILNRAKIARNAASSWSQSGHLSMGAKKKRRFVRPAAAAATMAFFFGSAAGYQGTTAFESPWTRLLDLDEQQARSAARAAHQSGLLNLQMSGNIVELTFPTLDTLWSPPS